MEIPDAKVERFSKLETKAHQAVVVTDGDFGQLDVHCGQLENVKVKVDVQNGSNQVTMVQGWDVTSIEPDGPFIDPTGYAMITNLRQGARFKGDGPY